MRIAAIVLTAVAVAGIFPAAADPFKLPAGAKVTQAQDGKGWLGSGSLPLSFTAAKARLGTAISAAGWAHLHTIELSKDRVLEAWSRRDEELTVMVWRIAAGRSGFSYGISKKAGAGKDAK